IGKEDSLGVGEVNLPYIAVLRVVLVCITLSIAFACLSITHTFANFHRPLRCCSYVESAVQITFWTLSAIVLLVIRHEWHRKWDGVMPETFVPDYPVSWHCAEVRCEPVCERKKMR
ncbi:hypothetical protein KIN20_014212, partial [Parelaphostrongylus tenuis]